MLQVSACSGDLFQQISFYSLKIIAKLYFRFNPFTKENKSLDNLLVISDVDDLSFILHFVEMLDCLVVLLRKNSGAV